MICHWNLRSSGYPIMPAAVLKLHKHFWDLSSTALWRSLPKGVTVAFPLGWTLYPVSMNCDLFNEEWLRMFELVAKESYHADSQEFINSAFFYQKKLFMMMFQWINNNIYPCHGISNNDAVINIDKDCHLFLHEKGIINCGWSKTKTNQRLLELFILIVWCLLWIWKVFVQFQNISGTNPFISKSIHPLRIFHPSIKI